MRSPSAALSRQLTGTAVIGDLTTIQVSNSIGRLHTHLGATIGDTSPEGIYLIGITLSMPGLLDSDPIAIMYNDLQTLLTSPDQADFVEAEMIGQTGADWTQDNLNILVPEPSSLALAMAGAAALAAVRCRRRRRTTVGLASRDAAVPARGAVGRRLDPSV